MPSVLVDTNLMLLLAVGLTSRSYIAAHGRLGAHDVEDFDAVRELVDSFAGLVCCPNVWSETSNFVRYAKGARRNEISKTLQRLIAASEEIYTPSQIAANREEYLPLGITDSVLVTMSETGCVLLTDDLQVYLAAVRAGYEAINYNHIREARYNRER